MSSDKYIHENVENKIYSYWEEKKLFKPKSNKKQFSIVIPPPNVTGSLHMGHALNNSIQDLLTRYHRMNNFETLWQPGTDHAGIATQALVEKKLKSEGIDKNDLGREKFIEKVWEWKGQYGDIIINQLKKLGCSCDWSRNAFTMDDNLSKSVLKVFVEMYKNGLIYKSKKLVNWDTVLKTAISDLEVDQREVNSKLYHINYPIEGTDKFITIATTRPETMLGDTAVAVNPSDERFKSLVNKNVIVPIVERKIKIIEDDYADPEQGTGAVKITPAHDFNDYEVGERNNLEVINVFTPDGKINENAPDNYIGLDRFEARKRILKELTDKNLFVKEEKIKNKVPYGDRSNSIIEPYLTEQWFADAKKLSIKAKEIVNNKTTNFFPVNWTKTYFQWMDNIEPWCISRQLWWGHQIPAWYGPDGEIFVDATVEIPVIKQLSQTSFTYEGGLKLPPELISLALALSLYTATFIAECVRAGVQGVSKGQKEAAASIGLTPNQVLKLVVMPQALRIIIPPTTNQYLNLTKNSSLAAAIAYPDLVLVFAGTALMQTGRAIEIVSITMLTYLTLSITISIFMNWYNKKIAIKEK